MERYFWMSTRKIKPDTREQFEQSWRPAEFPDGLVGAYVLYAEGGDEVVGISIWNSAEACDRYRRSNVEARRRPRGGPSPRAASWESQAADPAFARTDRRRGAVELLHRPRGWERDWVALGVERAGTRRS